MSDSSRVILLLENLDFRLARENLFAKIDLGILMALFEAMADDEIYDCRVSEKSNPEFWPRCYASLMRKYVNKSAAWTSHARLFCSRDCWDSTLSFAVAVIVVGREVRGSSTIRLVD